MARDTPADDGRPDVTMILHRTRYPTDIIPDEPEYVGTRMVGGIPDQLFKTGGQVVGVDWEREPGYVWVTFLVSQ